MGRQFKPHAEELFSLLVVVGAPGLSDIPRQIGMPRLPPESVSWDIGMSQKSGREAAAGANTSIPG